MKFDKVPLIVAGLLVFPTVFFMATMGDDPIIPIPSLIVDSELVYDGEDIDQDSNIVIDQGGVLKLISTTLNFLCTSTSTYSLEVKDGGFLYILDSSIVTSNSASYGFNMKAYDGGVLIIDSSTVSNVGADNNGIHIQTEYAVISSSTISSNDNCGIYIEDSSPRITDCTINNIDGDGIKIEGDSSPHIYGNTLTDNDRGLYVKDNIDEYDLSDTSWVDVTSRISNINSEYYTLNANSGQFCDIALLASGTTVGYSGANYGIWGNGGDPDHDIGEALDGDTTGLAMTNYGTPSGNDEAYFSLCFNKQRTISGVRIDFESQTNCLKDWKIYSYNGDILPIYGSNDWQLITSVTGHLNQDYWEYNLGTEIEAKYFLFKATDFNGEDRPKIKKFSVFSSDKIGVVTTNPIQLGSMQTWNNLFIDREINEDSDILVSVCEQNRINGNIIPIYGYEDLPFTDIDLSSIDPIMHSKIILRFKLLNSGTSTNYPKLNSFKISYSNTNIEKFDWSDSVSFGDTYENMAVSSGELHLESNGDYNSDTFDHMSDGNIDGQGGWSVTGSGTSCSSDIISTESFLGDKSLCHGDDSISGNNLVTMNCLSNPISASGIIEFSMNVNTISTGSYGYITFSDSSEGSTNGIKLRYVGTPSGTISSCMGLNYLEYYRSDSTWQRIDSYHQMNLSQWYYIGISFGISQDTFSIYVDGVLIGQDLSVTSLTLIDQVEIESISSSKFVCYFDEFFIYESDFEYSSPSATSYSMTLSPGESLSAIHFEFLTFSPDCYIYFNIKSGDEIYSIDSWNGYSTVWFSNIVDTTNKMDFNLYISFKETSSDFTPHLKRIWFEFNTIISDNDISCVSEPNGIGIEVENSDPISIIFNTITGCDNGIILDDVIGTIFSNSLDQNDPYGLKIISSDNIIVSGFVFDDNYNTIYCSNSIVFVEEAEIDYLSTGFQGLIVSGTSILHIVDPNYDYASSTISGTSKLVVSHYLGLMIDGYSPSEWDDLVYAKVLGSKYDYGISDYTLDTIQYFFDGNEMLLSEREIDSSNDYTVTPNFIEIKNHNRFYISMTDSCAKYIHYGSDSDSDHISDYTELDEGKYLYECEYMVPSSKLSPESDGAIQLSTDNEIIAYDVPIHESSPTSFQYSIAVRGMAISGSSGQSFEVQLWGDSSLSESFLVESDYEWYQTCWKSLPSGKNDVELKIVDLNSGGLEVAIDKFVVLKKGAVSNPPVLSSPLISDLDDDDLLDGIERTPNGIYFEGEHFGIDDPSDYYDIIDNKLASSSKYIKADSGDVNVDFIGFNFYVGSSGLYKVMVRARNDLTSSGHFQLSVSGFSPDTETNIDTRFTWYDFTYSLQQQLYTIKIRDTSSTVRVGIDRVSIIRVEDIEYDNSVPNTLTIPPTGCRGVNINVPMWGIPQRAYIEYTSPQSTSVTLNTAIGNVNEFDFYGNMTVYVDSQNNLKAFDKDRGLLYPTISPGLVGSTAPSVSMGKVAYHLPNGPLPGNQIYYCDLLEDHTNLQTYCISSVGGSTYTGTDPEIYDRTVVWKSDLTSNVYGRLVDSGHLITIPSTGQEVGPISSFLSLYDRSVVYTTTAMDGSSYVRLWHMGILADIQSNSANQIGLTPHMMTIASSLPGSGIIYHQASIYGSKVAYLVDNQGSTQIYVQDLTLNSPAVLEVNGLNIDTSQRILLWGNYLAWVVDGGFGNPDQLFVKELGSTNNVLVTSNLNGQGNGRFSLFSGRLEYILSSGTSSVMEYVQDFNFQIGNEIFYIREDLAQNDRSTYDFSDAIEPILYDERVKSANYNVREGFIQVPILISSQNGGTITIKKVHVDVDSVTDPFSNDFDGDRLSDGIEVSHIVGEGVFEAEDTFDFKEWIEPVCGEAHSLWSNNVGRYYKTSPQFYLQGTDLITGYNKEENPLMFELEEFTSGSFVRYDLSNTDTGCDKPYHVSIMNHGRKGLIIDDSLLPDREPLPPSMVRGTEFDVYGGYQTDHSVEENHMSSIEEAYIMEVLSHVIVVNHFGQSEEKVEITDEIKEFNILYSRTGTFAQDTNDYTTSGEYEGLYLVVNMTYSAVINCGGSPNYRLEVRCDLDLLPDYLDPMKKADLGDKSQVPDEFGEKRFNFIRLMEMDRIFVSRVGMDPTAYDTDSDNLDDDVEYYSFSSPIADDPDQDGLSDHDEIIHHFTHPMCRDTDGDSLRDGIELGPTASIMTLQSQGSWFERGVRNQDYFILYDVTNVDVDTLTGTVPTTIDTDGDGLPDGIVDGWYYFGDRRSGTWSSYYSGKNWQGSYGYDGLIQVWEGEDLNLDGAKAGGIMQSWTFDGLTFEFLGTGTAETDPNDPDLDNDGVPDGYEVWYATREPFVDVNGNLLIDPNSADSNVDYEPCGLVVSDAVPSVDGNKLVDSTNTRVAQEIYVANANHQKMITRIGISSSSKISTLEIWSGDNSGPISKLFTSANIVGTNGNWRIFDVPQGLFFNGITSGFIYYMAVPYVKSDVRWDYSLSGPSKCTYRFDSPTQNWVALNNLDMCYQIYIHDFSDSTDGLTLIEEFVVGTHPKNQNSDISRFGHYDDNLEDGVEVETYGGSGEVLLRTDITDGALGFSELWGKDLTSNYYDYNEDPSTTGSIYRYNHLDEGEAYTFTSWSYSIICKLRDGSLVTRCEESSTIYLIIWDSAYLDFDNPLEIEGNKVIECRYIRFIRGSSQTGSYALSSTWRGMDVYFSDPCRWDTDDDGLFDGEEIGWNSNSDLYSVGSRELTQLGSDTVFNVRDVDSDNDGLVDGIESNWDLDASGQGLDTDTIKNMVDPDSDGDGLWDGIETAPLDDWDNDDIVNMEDADSDGDGLCDGWADGYVWDPQANSGAGWFVTASSSTTFTFVDNVSTTDRWEGEDLDRDGEVESENDETDPLNYDTDEDGLWDGFDIPDTSEVHLGEIYVTDATTLDGIVTGFVYKRIYFSQQQSSTSSNDDDSDDDGLLDGCEAYSFSRWRSLKVRIPCPNGNGIIFKTYSNVKSDPSRSDSESDNVDDGDEYDFGTLPTSSDSDEDGLSDYDETDETNGKTSATNCDSDYDGIPDGFVDGWWYNYQTDKFYYDSSKDTTPDTRDPWEGEDFIDCDNVLDKDTSNNDPTDDETKPDDRDSDDDKIPDGYEYFFNLVIRSLDPGTELDVDNDKIPNPWDTDSDGDGLGDNEEDRKSPYGKLNAVALGQGQTSDHDDYLTAEDSNPFSTDSDDDGVDDDVDSPDTEDPPNYFWNIDSDGDGLINAMDENSDNDNIALYGDDYSDDYPLIDQTTFDTDNPPDGDTDNDDDGLFDVQEDTNKDGDYDSGVDYSDKDDDDTDSDGQTDYDEYKRGTDPTDPDTDDDGLWDGYDIYDGSTLVHAGELSSHFGYPASDPFQSDSDGDGLDDGDEYSYQTNPKNVDTDGDGLDDGHSKESGLDSDGDGIKNSKETDSDNDGVSDHNEELVYFLDSTDPDCDNDGLTDGFELNGGISDPQNPDSDDPTPPTRSSDDSDGLTDGEEAAYGTDYGSFQDRDTDKDQARDGEDFEPFINDCELEFSVRELIVYDKVDDNRADPFIVAEVQAKSKISDSWCDIVLMRSHHFGKCGSSCPIFEFGYTIGEKELEDPDRVFDARDDDLGEMWRNDDSKTRNEMSAKFNFRTVGLFNTATYVKFTIGIYDADTGSNKNDLLDISPVNNADTGTSEIEWDDLSSRHGRVLEIIYNTHTSMWYLEDSGKILEGNKVDESTGVYTTDDGNGMGICDGSEDWDYQEESRKKHSLDALFSFDIKPVRGYFSDTIDGVISPDDDKLTSYSEFKVYGTKHIPASVSLESPIWPESVDGVDTDEDGLYDWFEVRYKVNCETDEINPSEEDVDTIDPCDEDGLQLDEEQDWYYWGANPEYDDIFVEVDWMKEHKRNKDGDWNPFKVHCGHGFTEGEQNTIIKKFLEKTDLATHDMAMHIDDGSMGNGGEIPEVKTNVYFYTDLDVAEGEYYLYYRNKYFDSTNRNGVFHYGLMACCPAEKSSYLGQGNVRGDEFIVYRGNGARRGLYMHELGHNIMGNRRQNNEKLLEEKGRGGDWTFEGHCGTKTCIMHSPIIQNIQKDYCDDCWTVIQLKYSWPAEVPYDFPMIK